MTDKKEFEGVTWYLQTHERLVPKRQWRGGRIADIDPLSLDEAAEQASRHAGMVINKNDFLRAAGRGEILLRAIIHRNAKVQRFDGGIYCNAGTPDENIAPKGSIPTLPQTACQHLAAAGNARWRTFDGFERDNDGVLWRYAKGHLLDDEPDFETTLEDCRVIGYDVQALADAFVDMLAQADTVAPAPMAGGDDGQGKPTSKKSWQVNKPKREDTLSVMIYKTLKTANDSNEPRAPTARDVMEAIAADAPLDFLELSSVNNELKFLDSNGSVKVATMEAIRKRIKRMTERERTPTGR